MNQDTPISITPRTLADALIAWEQESKENNWPMREDPDRHIDTALWLIRKTRV
jgi:hypothetical protein